MVVAKHLSGLYLAYQDRGGAQHPDQWTGQSTGRPQGSLYSYQKKRIANAVAFIQSKSRPDCKPLIFVATSPGFTDRANEAKFISRLVDNLRKGYGCEHYIWVREFTGNGFPHFHFIATIPFGKKKIIVNGTRVPFDPVKLSRTWSAYFDSDAVNSIRLGSKPNKHGVRMMFLNNNRRKAWYLAKYIGKSKSDDEKKARAKLKTFHMDEVTANSIDPTLFKSKYPTYTKAVTVWNQSARKFETVMHEFPTGERVWENEKGELLSDAALELINWKYIGHECYSGFEKE